MTGFASLRRRRLAARLEWVVRQADRSRAAAGGLGCTIDVEEVDRARLPLLHLAESLRSSGPRDGPRIDLVTGLLNDADSPIFAPAWRSGDEAKPGELARRAREALAAPSP